MNASSPAPPTEEQPLDVGRLSRNAFEVLIGFSYGLAILAAVTRLILQVKIYRRLQVDDLFVIFACICLTASTVLAYAKASILYWDQELHLNPSRVYHLTEEHVDIAGPLNRYLRLFYSYTALLWAAIFAVKFGYLAFFRRLVDRVRPLIIYWRVIIGLSIVSLFWCVISVYVACEKWGIDATCLQPVYFHRAVRMAIADSVLDIATDLMIIGIPICLLWSVQIRARQKLVIGIFLSLNLLMTFTSAARVAGIDYHGTFDIVWLYLWHHLEACVAVITISLTAFRSVFVSSQPPQARRRTASKPWYSSTVAAILRTRIFDRRDEESASELAAIPSATLTGMRTFIPGVGRTETGLSATNLTTAG
ncbi:hypothetical protein MMC07_005056 [Pseudocyphellaria aurata]|nr:hypothetical protein [Pseudocyphellaria aurata]